MPKIIEDAEAPDNVELYDWDDHATGRKLIMDAVASEMKRAFPIEYGGTRIDLDNVRYEGKTDFDPDEETEALISDKYLHTRLRGTLRLTDLETGKVIDEKDMTLMKVPWLTNRGTFIRGGNEYSTVHQYRLEPGPYTRIQNNGELETQFNVRRGTGDGFRVALIPSTGMYRLRAKGSDLHLYSILHDLGVPDEELEKAWGKELLEINKQKYDPQALKKAHAKLTKPSERTGDMAADVRAVLDKMKLARYVAEKNLPNMFSGVGKIRELTEKYAAQKQEPPRSAAKESVLLAASIFGKKAVSECLIPESNGKAPLEKCAAIMEQAGEEAFSILMQALAEKTIEKISK